MDAGELTRAAQGVRGAQTVVAPLTAVTARTFDICFALTRAGGVVAAASVLRPLGTADATCRADAEEEHDLLFKPAEPSVSTSAQGQTDPYVCRRRAGPCGCGGWAGIPGHTGHTLVPSCGASSRRRRLRFSSRWPRTRLGQSDSAGRGCCTRILSREHGGEH